MAVRLIYRASVTRPLKRRFSESATDRPTVTINPESAIRCSQFSPPIDGRTIRFESCARNASRWEFHVRASAAISKGFTCMDPFVERWNNNRRKKKNCGRETKRGEISYRGAEVSYETRDSRQMRECRECREKRSSRSAELNFLPRALISAMFSRPFRFHTIWRVK